MGHVVCEIITLIQAILAVSFIHIKFDVIGSAIAD
jgi:hypothetical protein